MAKREGAVSTSGRPPPRRVERSRFGQVPLRTGAVVALAALAALVVWLVVESRGDSDSTPESQALSAPDLRAHASESGQAIYWVGALPDRTYELTEESNAVYLRYLPEGVDAGEEISVLTIGTYPMVNAYNAMRNAKGPGLVTLDVPRGGVAFFNTKRPRSVYVAYPGSDYQVEVYATKASAARQLATSGRVRPVVESPQSRAIGPEAVSPENLRSLAGSLRHPIYWAGRQTNFTYELTRTPSGWTYVRYLPPGEGIGARKGLLTVATYPMQNAFQVVQRATREPNKVTIELPRGGLAVYSNQAPTNAYLAYPGADVQVEVYDPSPSSLRSLLRSGRIASAG